MTKIIIVIFTLTSVFGFQNSCKQTAPANDNVQQIFNVDSKVELLFFYKKEATYEQRTYFYENILMRNTDRGSYMRDGVQASFGIDRNGYEGFGITLRPEVTQEQREDIKRHLKESPIVYKVYENVVPNEIKDL
jgi:hypothetical protein